MTLHGSYCRVAEIPKRRQSVITPALLAVWLQRGSLRQTEARHGTERNLPTLARLLRAQ
jgi:hypothetical protein